MVAEVYTTVKPVSPYRTMTMTLLLLILTCMLAADMSRSRHDAVFADSIRIPGWDISFHPPKGFLRVENFQGEIGQAVQFRLLFEQRGEKVNIELFVWRLPVKTGLHSSEHCKTLMRWLQAQSSWSLTRLLQLGRAPIEPVGERLGNVDAFEIIDHRISTVVRVGSFSDRWAYGVSMSIRGMDLERSLYSIFDRTCHSIKLESN